MIFDITPIGLLNVLLRRKLLFFSLFLLPVVLAAAYCTLATRIYRSEALLLFKFASRNMGSRNNLPDVALPGESLERRSVINSNMKILMSDDLMLDLLSKIDVEKLYPKLASSNSTVPLTERARLALFRDFSVGGDRESDVIEISLRNPNAEVAASTLTTLIRLFIDKQTKVYRSSEQGLMQKQVEEMQRRLAQSQDSLDKFVAKFGISSLDDERNSLLKLQVDARGALGQQQAKLGEAQGRRAAIVASLATLQPQIKLSDENDRYKAVDDARTRLSDLNARRAELQNYQPDSQTMRALSTQIESAQRELAAASRNSETRVRMGPNPVYQQAETDLVRADQDINSARGAIGPLEKQLSRYDDRLAELNLRQADYHTLVLKRDVDEQGYRTALQRADDARVADALRQDNISGVSILQEPSTPMTPIAPRKAMIMGVSFPIGFLLAVVACFMSEMFVRTFAMPGQIETALRLPVLASFQAIDE
jgi:uncharacterized protein involved in exopolysaccharide biosynthesis